MLVCGVTAAGLASQWVLLPSTPHSSQNTHPRETWKNGGMQEKETEREKRVKKWREGCYVTKSFELVVSWLVEEKDRWHIGTEGWDLLGKETLDLPGSRQWSQAQGSKRKGVKVKQETEREQCRSQGEDQKGERGCDQWRVSMVSLYPPAAECLRQHVAVSTQYQGLHACFPPHGPDLDKHSNMLSDLLIYF